MTTITRQSIKRHGGKSYLAEWIISQMPPRVRNPNAPAANDSGWCHYVEPYFGGGAVLFALDEEGISEVVNDIDGELTNFWDVLKSPELFAEMERLLLVTPVSKVEFDRARNTRGMPPAERAVSFFVRNRQSRQGLGRDFATIVRNRTRRGMNELPSAWLSAIDGLPEVHERLRRVVILNDSALKVIRQQDGPRTLFYLDPPYLHETRSSTGEYGDWEMSSAQHFALLWLLTEIKGRFLLSGYDSALYHWFGQTFGWACDSIEIDNKASSSKSKEKRREVLWRNF